jgi:hypothetical protein
MKACSLYPSFLTRNGVLGQLSQSFTALRCGTNSRDLPPVPAESLPYGIEKHATEIVLEELVMLGKMPEDVAESLDLKDASHGAPMQQG